MNQKIEGHLSASVRPFQLSVERRLPSASAPQAQPIAPACACDGLHLTCEAAGLQALQRTLIATPAVDPAKVNAVREELASGSYRIDPDTIAARMLELDTQLGA